MRNANRARNTRGSHRRARVPPGGRGLWLAALLGLCSCSDPTGGDASHRIAGAVHVASGAPPGSAKTVNGTITVDPNAVVTDATTVNGSVTIGARATATSVKAVNGSITLDDGARVAGPVQAVNGSLTLREGADVGGALTNVAGRIELHAAHVAGGIRTVAGDVLVLGASRVEGGLTVQKAGTSLIKIGSGAPRIVIGPGASVQGDLRFEREVRLYVSDKATVGPVTGATAIRFTGDSPPG